MKKLRNNKGLGIIEILLIMVLIFFVILTFSQVNGLDICPFY